MHVRVIKKSGLCEHGSAYFASSVGDIISVDDTRGRDLIEAGFAELSDIGEFGRFCEQLEAKNAAPSGVSFTMRFNGKGGE